MTETNTAETSWFSNRKQQRELNNAIN